MLVLGVRQPFVGQAILLMVSPSGFFGILFGLGRDVKPAVTGSTLVESNLLPIATHRYFVGLAKGCTLVPALNQIGLHPYFAQKENEAADTDQGTVTRAWSPIGGMTFYPGWSDGTSRNPLSDPVIARITPEHGKTNAQVMLRWHLQQGAAQCRSRSGPSASQTTLTCSTSNCQTTSSRQSTPSTSEPAVAPTLTTSGSRPFTIP